MLSNCQKVDIEAFLGDILGQETPNFHDPYHIALLCFTFNLIMVDIQCIKL